MFGHPCIIKKQFNIYIYIYTDCLNSYDRKYGNNLSLRQEKKKYIQYNKVSIEPSRKLKKMCI
jgi:hypothetical protein